MSENIRRFKVFELNRLLPMIRNTIEKEKTIAIKESEKRQIELELETTKKSINEFEGALNTIETYLDKNEETAKQLQKLISGKIEESQELERRESDCEKTINKLTNQWKLETNLYKTILGVLISEGGFLKSVEIQECFLKEYIYLIIIYGEKYRRFEGYEIFCKEDDNNGYGCNYERFYNQIYENLSPEHTDLLDKDRERTRTSFYKFF